MSVLIATQLSLNGIKCNEWNPRVVEDSILLKTFPNKRWKGKDSIRQFYIGKEKQQIKVMVYGKKKYPFPQTSENAIESDNCLLLASLPIR